MQFALAPAPSTGARWLATARQLARNPARAFAIVKSRIAGKHLRSRQALAALIGLDHRKLRLSDAIQVVAASGDATPAGATAIVRVAPGHVLVEGAVERLAAAFERDPTIQALYGDALVSFGGNGKGRIPLLRPAFDPEYLLGVDYVGPVVALRSSDLDSVGDVADAPSEAEAMDLLLRIADRFGREAVRHLPGFVSVWKPDLREQSTGTVRVGRLDAVRRHLHRTGETDARADMTDAGVISITRPLPNPPPLVSLIVPTRDRLDLLRPCIESLVERTDWPTREILICDNDSREPATHAYLGELVANGQARVIACPGPFNFAAMNNKAAGEARGTVLAFVNNDVEAFQPDWLTRMVGEALRRDVGAVGAKLLDGEGRIQHAGIVLGTGGLVTHGHRHFPGDAIGYLSALQATREVSAVTAACLVVEAAKFAEVGGFDADAFAVDFNDVDLCLRLSRAGYRTILVPSAVLHHREAASRRWNPEARSRHMREVAAFKERWGPLLAQDPHYHPGFDPDLGTYARLRRNWPGYAALGSR